MRASHLILFILLLSSVLLLTDHSTAQSVYGQVSGRLMAVAGTPVSGASVSLTSVQTGTHARTKSDTGGYFNISNLGPDLYQIDVQTDGFKRVQATIAVNADSTTSVNALMQAGDPNAVAQPMAGGGSALKLDRTDVSTLFDSHAVSELPLLDRNLTRLQLLVPGASRGKLFISSDQNPQNGQPVNINGQHFSGSAFQLDGTENRDPLEGIVVINPTLDSVAEMKVTTQGYNAEFGQSTAGVVTIQTKTGGNAWHGDGFGFRRTGWGQSVDPFAPAGVPPSKHILFGGSFGGPIVRNKLFIFSDYQGTRSSQGANVLLSVPPLSVRQSCLGSDPKAPALCDLSAYGPFISGTLVDPYHKDSNGNPMQFTCPQQGGPPQPCNEIPNPLNLTSSNVTDQAAALLKLLPPPTPGLPTDPTCAIGGGEAVCNNYLASGQERFSANQFDVRTDYNASSRFRLFGRYSFGDFSDTGAPAFGAQGGGLGLNPAGFAGVARTRNQGISSGFTYTFGPKILTDLRFGFFRYRLNVNAPEGQTPDIGIPGIFASDTHDPFATGLPDFQIPGQQTTAHGLSSLSSGSDYLRFGYSDSTNSCSCPLSEREQQFQFVNNWTRSSGRHLVKWGADLRYLQNYRLESSEPRTGFFSFAQNVTGLSLATFLLGDVTSFQRSFSSPAAVNAGEHQKRFGFYGQDTWRINSRLTVNYGLRWEIYFPQTVTGAGGFLVPNLSNHDPGTTYFNGPPTSNAAGGISGNLTNFAPRLGIAYLINPSSVIRAGYGRSFDAGYAGDLFGIAATQNPPVTVEQNVEAGGFNLADGPPAFHFLSSSHFSLLDLAAANVGDPTQTPAIPSSGAVLYALPSRVRVPTVDSWNLTFQHELTSHLYFELGYVGNKGTHVFADGGAGTYYDLNQPSLQELIVQTVKNGIPVQNLNYQNCKGGNKKGTKGAIFTYLPGGGSMEQQYCLTDPTLRSFYTNVPGEFNPTLFEMRYFGNDANDNYNSLQAKVYKNFTRGYSFLAHYTWSKGLDYDENYFAAGRQVGYGPANFDTRHRFVMTNIWDLPIGRGKAWLGGIGPAADRFLGGWALSAITVWRSGVPFSPSYVRGNCTTDTDPGDPCRPNRVGPVHISGTREQYFSTTSSPLPPDTSHPDYCAETPKFCGLNPANGQPVPGPKIGPWQRPGAGQIGNAGRNSLTGPGFFQSDIAVAKNIPLTERASLNFRADVFNAFNRVNLGNPNPCVDCSGGGSIASLAAGGFQREFQFSLRIQF
jgi:Carboxypeptidase regulatory-like domain/TonB dependent receptor